ncbi:MAG: AAA family ATPase [bacterium]
MPRNPRTDPDIAVWKAQLAAVGEGAPNTAEKQALLAMIQRLGEPISLEMSTFLLAEYEKRATAVQRLEGMLEDLRDLHARLTAPPLMPATYLGAAGTARGPGAWVITNAGRRVVTYGDGVDPSALRRGDEVLLAGGLNTIVSSAPGGASRAGEIGSFVRWLEGGDLLLEVRDEQVVATATAALREQTLDPGDLVRWDRSLWLAFERIEREDGRSRFCAEIPTETFDDLAGLDAQIDAMKRSIGLRAHHPELVARYRLRARGSVLLVGPPGTGKTMLVRAFTNYLGSLSPAGRARFIHVRPGELESMWFGQSQKNIRELFELANQIARENPDEIVAIFFDEVDAIAEVRGQGHHRVHDRVMAALLAELDGLSPRSNVLVMAATNRRDAIDPAALRPGRLGDEIIEVPRPGRAAVAQILRKVFAEDLPWTLAGRNPREAREEILAAAVARIFSPNGLGPLATLTFRDGRTQTVEPSHLVNGAHLRNVARVASERACVREADGRGAGLGLVDVLDAITDEMESAVRVLTPLNCAKHLDDFPTDREVVRIDPVRKPSRRSYRFLRAA